MHREELVEGLLVHELHAWICQLGANKQGKDAAKGEEKQRRTKVQPADFLVVGRRHVIPNKGTEAGLATLLASNGRRYGSLSNRCAGHFFSPSCESVVVRAATEFAGLISPVSP